MLAVAASIALQAQQSPATGIRDFWIYGWRTPKVEGTDARARVMADAGFTVINAEPGELDVPARHGLKAMIHTQEAAVEVARHRAVVHAEAVQIRDRPVRPCDGRLDHTLQFVVRRHLVRDTSCRRRAVPHHHHDRAGRQSRGVAHPVAWGPSLPNATAVPRSSSPSASRRRPTPPLPPAASGRRRRCRP